MPAAAEMEGAKKGRGSKTKTDRPITKKEKKRKKAFFLNTRQPTSARGPPACPTPSLIDKLGQPRS